jgi:uncharacterized membrane protein HdeD (DUF308 family)
MKKWTAISMIMIGILVLSLWTLLLTSHQVPELKTEFWSIATHIIAETLMAILLIISGIKAIKDPLSNHKIIPFALGTLSYSLVNSSGYYLEKGEYFMVVVFTLLLLFAIYTLINQIKSPTSMK